MEAATGIHDDWELLFVPDSSSGDDLDPSEAAEEPAESTDADAGAIKSDYFALDSHGLHGEAAALDSVGFEVEEVQVEPDGPGLLNPGTDSGYLSEPEGERGLAGNELLRWEPGEFGSCGSSDGQRSHLGSAKGFRSDEASDGQRSCLESEKEELGEGVWEVAGGDAENEKHGVGNGSPQAAESCESSNLSSGVDDTRVCPPGQKGFGMAWWKLPFQMLKFCAFRVKPIWSISVAAAMLGVWMLGKRLYLIKQKRRSIPLRLSLDEKKTSQLKIHAARLNESFSIVKRAPMIRAQLPAGGLPLPVLGFQ